jgi:hypothetical protein
MHKKARRMMIGGAAKMAERQQLGGGLGGGTGRRVEQSCAHGVRGRGGGGGRRTWLGRCHCPALRARALHRRHPLARFRCEQLQLSSTLNFALCLFFLTLGFVPWAPHLSRGGFNVPFCHNLPSNLFLSGSMKASTLSRSWSLNYFHFTIAPWSQKR